MLLALPDEHRQPSAWPQRAGQVGERRGRVDEEHGPEPADRHVEVGLFEAVHLGVAELEPDVGEPLGGGRLTGSGEHALGRIDSHDASGPCGAGSLARRQAGAAPYVEHDVTRCDPVGGLQVSVVRTQLRVVEIGAVQRGHARMLSTVTVEQRSTSIPRCHALLDGGDTADLPSRYRDLGRVRGALRFRHPQRGARPVLPYLQETEHISYVVGSLHQVAFALGGMTAGVLAIRSTAPRQRTIAGGLACAGGGRAAAR